MSAAHTPGRVVHDTRGYPHADVKAASGQSVAITWGLQSKPAKTAEGYQRRLKQGRANARRIVACWNACEGVDIDLLEQNPAPFSEMRSERDALLDLHKKHMELMIEIAQELKNPRLQLGTTAEASVRMLALAAKESLDAIAKAGGAA